MAWREGPSSPKADAKRRLQAVELAGGRFAALALADDLGRDARVGDVIVARPVGVDIGDAERVVAGRDETFAVQLVGPHQRTVEVEDGELAGRHDRLLLRRGLLCMQVRAGSHASAARAMAAYSAESCIERWR